MENQTAALAAPERNYSNGNTAEDENFSEAQIEAAESKVLTYVAKQERKGLLVTENLYQILVDNPDSLREEAILWLVREGVESVEDDIDVIADYAKNFTEAQIEAAKKDWIAQVSERSPEFVDWWLKNPDQSRKEAILNLMRELKSK